MNCDETGVTLRKFRKTGYRASGPEQGLTPIRNDDWLAVTSTHQPMVLLGLLHLGWGLVKFVTYWQRKLLPSRPLRLGELK